MAAPETLVFVRHGESEWNIISRTFEDGRTMDVPEDFMKVHDWQYRLSPKGVAQAEAVNRYLVNAYGDPAEYFDEHLVSPYIRPRETAAYVGGLACQWVIDDRLAERDWGIYNMVHPGEREKHFPHTERMREVSRLRWTPDGGESLTSGVLLRVQNLRNTLNLEQADKRVIAVTHGEFMWMVRYVIEGMLPEEWEAAHADKAQRLYNASLLMYTRANPEDPTDIAPNMRWRKIVCPWDESLSPFGGEWVELPGKRRFSGQQLLDTVHQVPRIFDQTFYDTIETRN